MALEIPEPPAVVVDGEAAGDPHPASMADTAAAARTAQVVLLGANSERTRPTGVGHSEGDEREPLIHSESFPQPLTTAHASAGPCSPVLLRGPAQPADPTSGGSLALI